MRRDIGKLVLILIFSTYIFAISSGIHYAVLCSIPVLYIFRDYVVLEILRLTNRELVFSERTYIRENYVYFPNTRKVLKLYKCSSLVSISQLTPRKLTNISIDLINRLTSVVEKVVIIKYCDSLYMGFIDSLSRDLMRVKLKFEDILREYFDFEDVNKTFFTSMLSCDTGTRRSMFIPFLIFTLPLFLCGISGIALAIVLTTICILTLRKFCVLSGWVRSLDNSLVVNEQLFKKVDDNTLKSLSLCLSRRDLNYLIIVQRSPDLAIYATSKIGKAQEQLVVRERGKGYAEVMKWKTVIDRISEGEEPLLIAMYVDSYTADALQGFFTFRREAFLGLTKSPYTVYALTRDIVPLLPLQGRTATNDYSSCCIDLGTDRSGKSVTVDLNELSSRHIMIVGPTGMGKTRTASRILQQLTTQNVHVIIFDPHGEYENLLKDKVKTNVEVINIKENIINIFDTCSLTVSEKVHRLTLAIEDSFNIKLSDKTYDSLVTVYRQKLHNNPSLVLRKLKQGSPIPEERLLFQRIEDILKCAKFVSIRDLLGKSKIIIFNFKQVLHSPDVLSFLMLTMFDTLYTWLASSEGKSSLRYVIVVDEAYYVLRSRLLELTIRGFRKLGVGTVLITQSISDLTYAVIENIGLAILLGGPDSYVANLASVFNLSQEDIDWLISALPPRNTGRTRALLVMGPTRYHVYINVMQ